MAGLDQIVVTARRREESLQEVPIAITAIPEEMLETLRIAEVEDLEILEPSLTVSPASGYPNKPVYSLRGIRPTETLYGQDPTVAVYFADVVQSPAQGSNFGFYDLESVQVLKGPQGTLFGRNTIGGAILLTPRKPDDFFSGYVEAGVGSYGLLEVEAAIDIPISETFRVRVAGQAIESEGYQTNVAPGPLFGTKLGGEETRSARLTAVWEPAAGIENTTIFSYDDKETNGRGTVLEAVNPTNQFIQCYDGPGNPIGGTDGTCGLLEQTTLPSIFDALERARDRDVHDVEGNVRAFDNVSAWSLINTTTADLAEDLTLKAIFSYREVDAELVFDMDGTAIPGILEVSQVADLQHYSGEVQLQGTSSNERLDWLLGFYYYHEEGEEYSPEGSPFFDMLLGRSNFSAASIDNDSYSVFAQASYDLTDMLTLTAGGRMNWDTRRMTILTQNAQRGVRACSLSVLDPTTPEPNDAVVLPVNSCAVPLKETFSQPTGTISIDYEITPAILAYATSRLGYRSGGYNFRADVPVEYEPFDPETVIDAEIGVKADWAAGPVNMRTNIAIYNQWYDDIQRTVAVENVGGNPGAAVVNAASAEVFGIEVQQTIQPTDGLTLLLSYTYVDPKYNEWLNAGVDISDTPFYFTPSHAGNVALMYERPLDNDRGSLHFTASAAYTGEHWINALHTIEDIEAHPAEIIPLLQQDDYWLFNVSAGWRDIHGTNIDLLAFVRNLTDEEYKTGGVQLYTGATGFITAAYGEPRTYGVQVRFNF
jgi:iron complex outermembrane receptor protein